MNILSRSCSIDTDLDSDCHHAAMTIHPCINDFGISIAMLCGDFYIAKRHGAMHIIAIPSERWLQDLKDDGFEIVQSLNVKPINI